MADLTGKIIKNRYRVDELLGRGGMAEVYRVYDLQRHSDLAMKVLREDLAEDNIFIRRFEREGQTLAKLAHSNVVRFYGLGHDGDLVFLLMEFIDGVTLRKIISKKRAPFTNEMVLAVLGPVCSALNFAHQSGRVHCDIKPANIMIDKNNHIFVTDFGIARMSDAATATMVGAGAPAYMAPEQILGKNPTPQTDIYSLGVMLYEMLTGGERPFKGEEASTGTNTERIRWEQLHLSPPSPRVYNPKISTELEAVVLRCLEKDPKKRFGSMSKFYEALKQSLGDMGDAEAIYDWKIKGYVEDGGKTPVPPPVPIDLKKILLIVAVTGIALFILSQFSHCLIPLPGSGGQNAIVSQTVSNPTATLQGINPTVTIQSINPTTTFQGTVPPACITPGSTWKSPIDDMVLHCVPAGNFIYGASRDSLNAVAQGDELLNKQVYMSAFWVDETEVSNAQFQKFVNETGHITTAEKNINAKVINGSGEWSTNTTANWQHPSGGSAPAIDNNPVVQVSWTDAKAYCEWTGRSLPSEAQWEKAARGLDGYLFPFEKDPNNYVMCFNGNFADKNSVVKNRKSGCNDKFGFLAPVDTVVYIETWLGACDSIHGGPFGTKNMLGNAWEWCLDDYSGKFYKTIPLNDPINITDSALKVMRGGSWGSMPEKCRPTNRDNAGINDAYDTIGFRCVYNP